MKIKEVRPVIVSRRVSEKSLPKHVTKVLWKVPHKKILLSKVKMNSSQFSMVFFMELAEIQIQKAGAE